MTSLHPGPPRHRSILAVDIEGSTTRTNTAKADLREAMYSLLERSLLASGIAERHRDDLVDRGDGILALIHPVDEIPKTLLLSGVIPALDRMLTEHAEQHPEQHLRMRAVLHAGEVHHDGKGCFGEALDVAFRLLDAPEVKKVFRTSPGHLLLVASDHIYRSVIRHGYNGIDERRYVRIADVEVGGQRHLGWVYQPEAADDHEVGSLVDVRRRRARRILAGTRRVVAHGNPA